MKGYIMKFTLHIPIKPVSVNEWKIPIKSKYGLGMTLSKEYRSFLEAVQRQIKSKGCQYTQEMINRAHCVSDQKYGLIISMKKDSRADYSNYAKAIEDALFKAHITPDDKHALFSPIVHGNNAPDKGFTVTILYDDQLKSFYLKQICSFSDEVEII